MEQVEKIIHDVAVGLSSALEPLMGGIERLNRAAELQLEATGLGGMWAPWVVALVWLLIVLMLLRVTFGWLRVIVLVCVVVVLAKFYGVMPTG